jgi:hypothetical protein
MAVPRLRSYSEGTRGGRLYTDLGWRGFSDSLGVTWGGTACATSRRFACVGRARVAAKPAYPALAPKDASTSHVLRC